MYRSLYQFRDYICEYNVQYMYSGTRMNHRWWRGDESNCSRNEGMSERLRMETNHLQNGLAEMSKDCECTMRTREDMETKTQCLFGTGTARSNPIVNHETKQAIIIDLTTISHWPRITTGLNTRVRGEPNAGTSRIAFTILNCLLKLAVF